MKYKNWTKLEPEVAGAIATYRKGRGLVRIHDYNRPERGFHMEYIGVNELFNTLKQAKQYGNNFVQE